jgi:hypothetical protein
MLFIYSTPELIRNLFQLKTAVFLHWCLICAVPLKWNNLTPVFRFQRFGKFLPTFVANDASSSDVTSYSSMLDADVSTILDRFFDTASLLVALLALLIVVFVLLIFGVSAAEFSFFMTTSVPGTGSQCYKTFFDV